jgi:hypothetical protein
MILSRKVGFFGSYCSHSAYAHRLTTGNSTYRAVQYATDMARLINLSLGIGLKSPSYFHLKEFLGIFLI